MNSAAAPSKRTPLHAAATELSAWFVDLSGWEIPGSYTSVESEVETGRERVGLVDETPNGKVLVEGDGAADAMDCRDLSIGAGAPAGAEWVYRLRGDHFFIHTAPGGDLDAAKAVRQGQGLVTVTNMTHAWSEIRVLGPAAADLMSKICGMNFHPSKFPDQTAVQTSVAKTRQLVIRNDVHGLPSYSLLGARSLGRYLWDVLMEAGEDWEIAPIGTEAMDEIGKSR